ncbi:MAG: aspartyl/asparaginyl beta-hydroxylase domain-containing protein [Chitinophagaceae bacterium]
MKIWYSYKGVPYKGSCPAYYQLSDVDWFKNLQNNLPLISSKTKAYLEQTQNQIFEYFNNDIVKGKATWDVSTFLFWGIPFQENNSLRNSIFKHFSNIPGLVSVSISILSEHTEITPHYGDTDAVYRLHIPIKIPDSLPLCGLKVNGISKSWSTTEIISFCDGHLHEAWNKTNKKRVILIVDVIKKELLPFERVICNNVLSLIRLQKILLQYRFLQFLPKPLKGVLRYFFKLKIYFEAYK